MIRVSVVATKVHYSNLPSKDPAGRKTVGRQPSAAAPSYPSQLAANLPQIALLMTKHCKDTEPAYFCLSRHT